MCLHDAVAMNKVQTSHNSSYTCALSYRRASANVSVALCPIHY